MSSRNVEKMRSDLVAILDLVEDNQYASAFQSVAQYRTALQQFIRERSDAAAALAPAPRRDHVDPD